jgi:hypothetical protein
MTDCLLASAILCLGNEPMVDFSEGVRWTVVLLPVLSVVLYGGDSVNIACCLENFILTQFGPA